MTMNSKNVVLKLPAKGSSTHGQIHISVYMVEFDGIWTKPHVVGAHNFPMVTGITNAWKWNFKSIHEVYSIKSAMHPNV